MTKPELTVVTGGAAGCTYQEVVQRMVKRLGGNQQAMDYLSAVHAKRRAMCDVATGRRAAEHLLAIPLYAGRGGDR